MKVVFGFDETGKAIEEMSNGSTVSPDASNFDTIDFPRKGCRYCGKRDRPQYKGTCNDDNCGH